MLFATLLLAPQIAFAALVDVPDFTARIIDLTQTLSEPQLIAFEAKLQNFEQKKGSQIAVLIVPTTQPEDIAQYAIRVVDQWKVGRKDVDDGLLLLIAKDDRKMRIEVGYGLEGAIPDLYAKRIINEAIAPRLKQGDFAGGIDAGLNALIGLVEGEPLPTPVKARMGGSLLEDLMPLLIFGGMISGLFLSSKFGTFLGSVANGGLIGSILFFFGLSIVGAGVLGLIAFFFTMMMGGRGINGYSRGSPSSGGFGGGFGGGMGGGFGGGGASGSW